MPSSLQPTRQVRPTAASAARERLHRPAGQAERLRRTRDLVENAGSAPADRLGALAFTALDRLGARTREIVGRNITRARAFLAAQPGLVVAGPVEASIMFPKLAGATDADTFADELLAARGVAVAPGSFFGAAGHIRISLAGEPGQVATGFEHIASFLAR